MTVPTPVSRSARIAAEAIGTFFLVIFGPGAVMVNAVSGGSLGNTGVSLSFAFIVTAMVFAVGNISGAHINPAVTIAAWSVRRFPSRDVVPYIVAQCTGAAAAAAALGATMGREAALGATLPSIPVPAAFAVEWILSFALMFVIAAAGNQPPRSRGLTPIAIGLTVGVCSLVGGPLTGASMNPARSFGPALAATEWHSHWIYWLAPVTAMIVAARVYEMMRVREAEFAA